MLLQQVQLSERCTNLQVWLRCRGFDLQLGGLLCRASDVSKLSFVVELAAGFYDQTNKVQVQVSAWEPWHVQCRVPVFPV